MFGEKLKALRQQEHMTQQDLSQSLGITVRALSSYELNQSEPNFDVIRRIAHFFHTSLDYFFDIDFPETDENDSQKKELLINKISALSAKDIDKVAEYVEFIESRKK